MTEAAIKYLTDKEWSMGNGQCPDCQGAHAGWYGHPWYKTPDTIGHKEECPLAAALASLGQSPLMIGGFYSARLKADGRVDQDTGSEKSFRVMILGGSMREKVGLMMLEEIQRMFPAQREVFALEAHELPELRHPLPEPKPLHPYGPAHRRGKGKMRKFA